MTEKLRHVLLASLLAAAAATAVDASEFSDDLAARRARMMDRLGPEALLVLWSAPPRVYSLDVNYEFRQDSNLYYLTGLTQEDTILVLMPGNRTKRELLFIRDRDPVREHWNGLSLSREQATSQTGIPTVYSVREFDAFVAGVLSGAGYERLDTEETPGFTRALAEGRAKVALDLGPRSLNTPLEGP